MAVIVAGTEGVVRRDCAFCVARDLAVLGDCLVANLGDYVRLLRIRWAVYATRLIRLAVGAETGSLNFSNGARILRMVSAFLNFLVIRGRDAAFGYVVCLYNVRAWYARVADVRSTFTVRFCARDINYVVGSLRTVLVDGLLGYFNVAELAVCVGERGYYYS